MNPLPAICLLIPLLLAPGSPAVAAQEPRAAGPVWRELVFERRSMWATARSKLSLGFGEDERLGPVRVLRVESSLASNTESETQLMRPGGYTLLRRERFTSGKNQRVKEYRYGPREVERIRREPGASPDLPTGEWPVSSRRSVPYPEFEGNAGLTSMQALLLLAGEVAGAPGESRTTYVHSDFNFYRVRMSVGGEETLAVNYTLDGGSTRVKGKRAAVIVRLDVDPAGTAVDAPDFSLLGLGGKVTVALDRQTLLPVQVRGTAPRLGETSIDLIAAEPGEPDGERMP